DLQSELHPTSTNLGDEARLEAITVFGDVPGSAPPDFFAFPLKAMLERRPQAPQPKGLAEYVGVNRDIHHERVALALPAPRVEIVDDHVAEVRGVLPAVDDDLRVVELYWVGHGQERPRTRAQPHRLIVHRP